MSNAADDSSVNNQPLFGDIDNKERATGASETDLAAAGEPHGPQIAGAEGSQQTTPVVAVRPDVSAATPIMLPATTDAVQPDDDATESTRPL